MRRITLWLMSTLSALVLLFSYPTSTSAKAKTAVQAEAPITESSGAAAASGGSTAGSSSAGSGSNGAASQGDSSSGGATPSSKSTSSGSSTTSSSGSGSSTSGGTFTGDSVMTRWGVVQVQITVANGKITKAGVTQIPWDNPRDQEINSYAVPVLNDEVVTAQSASIDMVSGATVTSDGYIQSLQSAIDQAHL